MTWEEILLFLLNVFFEKSYEAFTHSYSVTRTFICLWL
jgi:hypothetical protein